MIAVQMVTGFSEKRSSRLLRLNRSRIPSNGPLPLLERVASSNQIVPPVAVESTTSRRATLSTPAGTVYDPVSWVHVPPGPATD
jgi:hypothetical protein